MKAFIVALALLLTAGAVPDGMGGWDNGTRDYIPPSSSLLRWRYDSGFDALWRDRIMYGVAAVDYQLPSVRLLYSLSDSPSPYQLHFDLVNDAPPPACQDVDPATECVLARTTCGTAGANVDALGADGVWRYYRMCNMFRVAIYPQRIDLAAARAGEDLASFAIGIVRHEVGHALGLRHAVANLNQTVSPCARAMVEAFIVDDSPTWTAVPAPEACQ